MDDDPLLLAFCECEFPGPFCSGVPGVLAMMEHGRLAPGAVVERCDQCQRFESDEAALRRLVELGLADASLADQERPFTVHCFAVVRLTKAGVLAGDPKDAVQHALERFAWKSHAPDSKFAGEFVRFVVESDGEHDDRRTCVFDGQFNELPPGTA